MVHCNYHLLKNICLLGRNTGKPTIIMLTLNLCFSSLEGGLSIVQTRQFPSENQHSLLTPLMKLTIICRFIPLCLQSSVLPKRKLLPFLSPRSGPHICHS